MYGIQCQDAVTCCHLIESRDMLVYSLQHEVLALRAVRRRSLLDSPCTLSPIPPSTFYGEYLSRLKHSTFPSLAELEKFLTAR
jgi:hypothetical protein